MKRLFIVSVVILSTIVGGISQNIPLVGRYFFTNDVQGNTRLVCKFYFSQPITATVICSNQNTNERYVFAKDQYFKTNLEYSIGYPFTANWTWMPGEKLTITASGYTTFVFQIPYMGTPQWDQFVASMGNNQQPSYPAPSYPTPTYPTPSYQRTERVCPHCNGTRKDPYAVYTAPHYTSDRSCCAIPKDMPGSCKVSKICTMCGGTGTVR